MWELSEGPLLKDMHQLWVAACRFYEVCNVRELSASVHKGAWQTTTMKWVLETEGAGCWSHDLKPGGFPADTRKHELNKGRILQTWLTAWTESKIWQSLGWSFMAGLIMMNGRGLPDSCTPVSKKSPGVESMTVYTNGAFIYFLNWHRVSSVDLHFKSILIDRWAADRPSLE